MKDKVNVDRLRTFLKKYLLLIRFKFPERAVVGLWHAGLKSPGS